MRDLHSSFPAATALPLATRHSTPGSSSPANALGCRSFLLIPCGIRPRRYCSTSVEPTCVTYRPSLGIRVWRQQRVTHTSIPSDFAHWLETSGCTGSVLFPWATFDRRLKGWGRSPPKRSCNSSSLQARAHGGRTARETPGIFRRRCRRVIDLPWNPWAARQRHGQIELVAQNLENAIALSTSVPRRIPPST